MLVNTYKLKVALELKLKAAKQAVKELEMGSAPQREQAIRNAMTSIDYHKQQIAQAKKRLRELKNGKPLNKLYEGHVSLQAVKDLERGLAMLRLVNNDKVEIKTRDFLSKLL